MSAPDSHDRTGEGLPQLEPRTVGAWEACGVEKSSWSGLEGQRQHYGSP
jgi:hypothetical protein